MHKLYNSFFNATMEMSGKWKMGMGGKAIRLQPQVAQDHLPKCISLMFSIFATT